LMGRIRVGLDGRALGNISRLRGIGRYTARLVEALVRAGGDNDFVLLGYGEGPDPDLLDPELMRGLEWREIPRTRARGISYLTLLGEYLNLARAVRGAQVDIFHGIDHNVTPFLDSPSIVTVHDLIPLVLRGPYLGPTSWLCMQAHHRAAVKARAVVAVSRHTARDIERIWSIPVERIAIIPEGVSDIYRPVENGETVSDTMAKYGIGSPYLLYLGGFDPRKNIHNMLLSFKRFSLRGGAEHQLVLCGETRAFDAYLQNEIEELGLKGSMVLTGFAQEEDLPALYTGAVGFLCLSLYEGFGLPLLEAMACGCPVLASRAASIPEVVENAAILVDPLSPTDITEGLERLVYDGDARARLIESGLRRSTQFTWDRAAQRILMLYHEVQEGGGRD